MDADAARPTIGLTWLAAAFGCAATALASAIGADARWLAAIGGAVVHAGAIPRSVPYAAAPSDWHDAPVLGQLVFHAAQSLLGDHGFVLLQVLAVAIAFGALAYDLRRAGAGDSVGAAVLVAIVVAAPASFFIVRAQLFSIALFPVLVAILREDARRPSARLWFVVPLFALWANLHGGVLVGFGALAICLVLRRRAPAVLAVSALALFATPELAGTFDYYGGVLGSAAARTRYGLWGTLSPRQTLDLLYIAVAVPLLAVAVRRRLPLWELALLLTLGAMSIESRRNGLWFLLVVAVPAATSFRRAGNGPVLSRKIAVVCAAVPVFMLALGLAHSPVQSKPGIGIVAKAIAAADGSPILAEPIDAEQLALDGRRIWIGNPLDAFAQADQRAYIDWLRGRPAGDAILRGPVRVVLVRRGSVAQKRLAREGGYRELASDPLAVLYGRSR